MSIKKSFGVLFFITIIITLLNLLYPLDQARLHKPSSPLIYDRNHQLLSVKLSSDGYLRIPIKQTEISPTLKKILYAYEDQYFEQHWGVNPLSILRALWANLAHQQRIGASTLTMQVVRMMHHKPRTFTQKIIEIFQAFQLEWNYSKAEILTFYLNNTPYGGNVEGFASASFRYFGLPPSSLSMAQIAYLVSIPKNPNRNSPKKNRDINRIKNRLLDRIHALLLIDPEAYQQAKAEQINAKIKPLPNEIPHLSVYLKEGGEMETSIDLQLQRSITQLLKDQVSYLKRFGIHNGSAIVINNKTMKILVYVGSQDFHDKQHGGENDGLNALVSPGSTMKPFIYAKALEAGMITPLKKLYDVPLFIEGYQPQNYSRKYLGEVTATQALQLSLNIPAVELDRLLQEKSLYSLLKQANIPSLRHKKSHYGSALVLGGWGLSLRHNAELFAMLANGGVFQRSRYLQEGFPDPPQRILSQASSYLVSEILANAPRQNFSSSWEFIKEMPKVAFKTGTSAHAKDILTLGYTPEYTVGIWFGNFSGKQSHGYKNRYATGLTGASTILFKSFKLLGRQSWFQEPKEIKEEKICQDAILLGACKEEIKDKLIEGVIPKTPCMALRAEVLAYLIKNKTIDSIASLQQHHCYPQWRSYKPLITSPSNEKKYTFNRMLPQRFKKTMLQCYSFEANSTIYWLIDNQSAIISHSGEKIYQYLEPKQHKISCIDEGAKRQNISIIIEEL